MSCVLFSAVLGPTAGRSVDNLSPLLYVPALSPVSAVMFPFQDVLGLPFAVFLLRCLGLSLFDGYCRETSECRRNLRPGGFLQGRL